MALLLGLFAALCWGVHDVAARVFTQRMGAFRLGMRTELAGFILLLPVVVMARSANVEDWLLVGLLAVLVFAIALIPWLIGDTSRISMESRSRPVRTRCRPSTSPCPTSDSQRSRLRLCG